MEVRNRTEAVVVILAANDALMSLIRAPWISLCTGSLAKREVLDMIKPGDEFVEETFARLIAEQQLVAYPHEGFFGAMDTIKDRQCLENLHESGQGAVGPRPRQRPADGHGACGHTC